MKNMIRRSCRFIVSGFTLIEILVALLLLGLLLSYVIPSVDTFRPGYERKAFIADVSALTQRSWQNALVTQCLHRMRFDFARRTISVEQDTGTKDVQGNQQFKLIPGEYIKSEISWPEHLQIKDFFIDGVDQMHRIGVPGFKIEEAWFYTYPDGSVQEVVINLFDTKDATQSDAGTRLSLVLSPFTAKFTSYDTFQQP
jgi:prepilin-type N-terminal cleavage/methylation domain-containing protein